MSMIETPEQPNPSEAKKTTDTPADSQQSDAWQHAMRKEEIVRQRIENPATSRLVGAASIIAAVLLIGYTTELPFFSSMMDLFAEDEPPATVVETLPAQPQALPDIMPSETPLQNVLQTARSSIEQFTNQFGVTQSFADLSLRQADFREQDLKAVDFTGADLEKADFDEADLRAANMSRAILVKADFDGADLRLTDFSHANLEDANLSDADLRGAILSNANLTDANLDGADLRGAILDGAVLDGANIDDAIFR